jgi:FlaG/FlaF family flagellin (archaellin)
MVVITVILAAVIGAFVLEIGDQQETAPNTSFDSGQEKRFYWGTNKANLTTVSISHAGGSVVDITQADISVEGNTSAWGIEEAQSGSSWDYGRPQPDVRSTLGTNEPAQFQSGQTWEIFGYNGLADDNVDNEDYLIQYVEYTPGEKNDGVAEPVIKCCGAIHTTELDQGQQVNVVWRASSGGKTQTLFKYSVQ